MAKNKICISALLIAFSLSCFAQQDLRAKVRISYLNNIGVREATGNNDGKSVEIYLRSVGLTKGNPWCAAFVCFILHKNGVPNPMNGYSPVLFPPAKVIYQPSKNKAGTPRSADVFGIWFANKGRIAHVGFIDAWGDQYAITVEGNTNEAGSRDGDGVYRKRRLTRQIYAVSSYIQ